MLLIFIAVKIKVFISGNSVGKKIQLKIISNYENQKKN